MSQNKKTADPSACVHCHLCQKSCRFLEKYQMDIGDIHKIDHWHTIVSSVENVHRYVQKG